MTDSETSELGGDASAHSESTGDSDGNALLSRLRLIEDQPLEKRAEAFTQVHDELKAALDGGDATQRGE